MGRRSPIALALLLALSLSSALAAAPPTAQTPDLAYNEAMAVYLANLGRRNQGQPPLRANRQLTEAARWFAWDSVESRASAFCGHTDSLGRTSDQRARAFGYLGSAGSENALCGYANPSDAVNSWLNSPSHRANLLDGTVRETGLGYYQRAGDGRGYIVQMFARDPDYMPVVINNEAPSTTSPQVSLYVYNRVDNASFAGINASRFMRVANNPCFNGAQWQPFVAEQTTTLAAGTGWRTLYVQTRDRLDRTATASDAIYLGSGVPPAELSLDQQSTTSPYVTIYNLNGGSFNQVQFSPGWIVDDTYTTFERLSGAAARVNDAAALGGTAFQLGAGGPSSAWVWTTTFLKGVPLVAYARLKVDSNASPGEVVSFTIGGGGTSYGPLSLRGSDFAASGQYQEFALPFVFNNNSNDQFLTFKFARSGPTAVSIDSIAIYSQPQPITGKSLVWAIPGGNYRGQGIQLRYTDGAGHFGAPAEAQTVPDGIALDEASQSLLAQQNGSLHPQAWVNIEADCLGGATLSATSDAGWLQPQIVGDQLLLKVNQAGLALGHYQATATVKAPSLPNVAPAQVSVALDVVAHLSQSFMPLAQR